MRKIKNMHRAKILEWSLAIVSVLTAAMTLTLVVAVVGCTTPRPPQRIREAVAVMDEQLAEYVTEANAALHASGHPDAERLAGMGSRLEETLGALDRWASGLDRCQGIHQNSRQDEVQP